MDQLCTRPVDMKDGRYILCGKPAEYIIGAWFVCRDCKPVADYYTKKYCKGEGNDQAVESRC